MCVFALVVLVHAHAQTFKAVELQTEYLTNPIGIDQPNPRLTWKLDDKRKGANQIAYRVFVSTDSVSWNNENKMWETDWVKASSSLIVYKGKPLKPFTQYFWRVEVESADGEKTLSKVASFEMGLMHAKNWKGAWISDGEDIALKPAPLFRKEFTPSKKIRSARAYIATGGLYELYINGKRIGDHRLDPAYTRFDRRIIYVAHDVTEALNEGANAIGVMLGNGWYNHQSTAVWDFHRAPWRNRPAFCLDLLLTYDDGTSEVIFTDTSWKTSLGPVIFNSIYTAEHYDARLEQDGWSTSKFDASKWKDITLRAAPSTNIVSQALHPIRNVEEVKARSVKKFNDTTYVFDLGRNISGVSKFRVPGPAGTTVRLKHGERLFPDGRVDISNIDPHYRPVDDTDPFQTDIFILSGKDTDEFVPRFNYKGFQYVEVTTSRPLNLSEKNLTAYFMHSDVPPVGKLTTSNEIMNKVLFATNNSYLSNLFGYPTDCPQREKNGWTGDAHIAIETALYGFDGITVYEKWLADHRDEQQPNGVLPAIIPTGGWGYHWANGPDWTSTVVLIPWNVYLFYGDAKILEENYDNMKRYVDHITFLYPGGLTTWGLGDWVPVKSKSPVELTSTCYYYADAVALSKIAAVLGYKEDQQKYDALAGKIKNAFNEKYYKKDAALYGDGLQTELSAPLFWGLVPEDDISRVASSLAERVAKDNFHLDVGLLGQKAILNALSENGYADVAYRVASQETYPSWGWWIRNGATTLYENWDPKAKYDISMNHIMFGEIGAWMYKALGGIKPDPDKPGFGNVILRPHFVDGLKNVTLSYNSVKGEIKSKWEVGKKSVTYSVTIPANTTATFYIPQLKGKKMRFDKKVVDDKMILLQAGTYEFEWR